MNVRMIVVDTEINAKLPQILDDKDRYMHGAFFISMSCKLFQTILDDLADHMTVLF